MEEASASCKSRVPLGLCRVVFANVRNNKTPLLVKHTGCVSQDDNAN